MTLHRSPLYLFAFITIAALFLVQATSCTPDNTPDANPPDASFTYTSTRNFPVNVQFVNTSTSSAPGPSTFAWDFGDGSFLNTTGSVNPLHAYVAAGAYLIKLIQTQSDGVKDTVILAINLSPTGPSGSSSRSTTASFLYSITNNSFTTTFTNSTLNAESYLWEFGDGTTSTSASSTLTKSYTAPGTYHAKLTATGPGGVDTCSTSLVF
ncbi:MAG: PKD domain-containing protein [Chitinophagaceae bacterium]